MLYPINIPLIANRLTWVVQFQGHLIHALCDQACCSDQIQDEQWMVDLSIRLGLGIDSGWIKKFCEWTHEKARLIDRLRHIADLDPAAKSLIQAAFDHDIQIDQAYSDDPNHIHNPIGLSNLAHLPDVKEVIHRFFESFYDPALYRGYTIPEDGQQVQFNREGYLDKFREANSDILVCPMCDGDLGSPKVDHFLPKAQYPYLSCHPKNLVPICDDCNGPNGKFQKLPISPDAVNHTFDWLHPYLRTANNAYKVVFLSEPEGLTPVLRNDDAQINTRLDTFSDLVNLRSRWRNALSRKVRATQRKIDKEIRRRNSNLNDQELIMKIEQWGENQECEIGLEPFAIVEHAYLQSVSALDPATFDELLVYANQDLDVVNVT